MAVPVFMRGSTFQATVRITNTDTSEPESVMGWDIAAQVRQKQNGNLVDTLDVVATDLDNKFKLKSSGPTSNWPDGVLVWNIRFMKPDGVIFHTESGEFKSVTPPTQI